MRICVVDAFAEGPFSGNPAGVCLLDGPTPEGWMQAVAGELALSETAFSWPEGAGRRLRWFTPAAEVDLCGHATLATAHVLHERGLVATGTEVVFATRAGRLSAVLLPEGLIILDFPADQVEEQAVSEELVAALGVPVVAAGRGSRDLVAEVADVATLDACMPDLRALVGMARGVVVTTRGEGDVDVASRFFAPGVGVDEDPVTGSAHCSLAPWWAPRLGPRLRCEQRSQRGGKLVTELDGDRVRLGGYAVTMWEGVLTPAAQPPGPPAA